MLRHGTTVTLAYISNKNLYIGHVGDSRAYAFKDGNLLQITEDHSLVEELIKMVVLVKKKPNIIHKEILSLEL